MYQHMQYTMARLNFCQASGCTSLVCTQLLAWQRLGGWVVVGRRRGEHERWAAGETPQRSHMALRVQPELMAGYNAGHYQPFCNK